MMLQYHHGSGGISGVALEKLNMYFLIGGKVSWLGSGSKAERASE